MASTTHMAIVICQKTSVLGIICRVSLIDCVIEHLVKEVSHLCQLCIRLINGGATSGLFTMYSFQRMSSTVHPQPQVDFLNGMPHRKHPGVTNLKTLRLPEQLQRAAQSIVLGRCFFYVAILIVYNMINGNILLYTTPNRLLWVYCKGDLHQNVHDS